MTGASGFIGQRLIISLSKIGHYVKAFSRKKINLLSDNLEYKNINDYRKIINTDSSAICIHLAGESVVSVVENDFHNLFSDSLDLAEHLLSQNFNKIIFTSSAMVYGASQEFRSSCEIDPINTQNAYAKIKHSVEKKLLSENHIIVRLSNVYGINMLNKNIFYDIMSQIPQKGPLRLKNSFDVIDIINIEDVICAIVAMVSKPKEGIFNISSGIGIRANKLAKEILKLSGQPERNIFSHKGINEASYLVLNNNQLKKHYNWYPKVGFTEGIKQYVSNFTSK